MVEFRKWTSIESLANVVKALNYRKYSHYLKTVGSKITFFGKIKLHGTNAAVIVTPSGEVFAQKRSSVLSPSEDNAGFRVWVEANKSYFASLAHPEGNKYIYGEWCGPGIQSKVACSMTRNKIFYVFSILVCSTEERMIYDPDLIDQYLQDDNGEIIDRVMVLPYHCKITLDFNDKDQLKATVDNLNKEVESIGKRDPFMFENFEIEGAGEGLVMYPVIDNLEGEYESAVNIELGKVFMFKAKSEEHRVNKTKEAASIDPEKIATKTKFCETYCTTQRFEQGFQEAINSELDMKLTGEFVKWVCQDVYKESELERAQDKVLLIKWKSLSSAVASQAAVWYKQRVQSLNG